MCSSDRMITLLRPAKVGTCYVTGQWGRVHSKRMQQNINQSETGIGGPKLSVELYVILNFQTDPMILCTLQESIYVLDSVISIHGTVKAFEDLLLKIL